MKNCPIVEVGNTEKLTVNGDEYVSTYQNEEEGHIKVGENYYYYINYSANYYSKYKKLLDITKKLNNELISSGLFTNFKKKSGNNLRNLIINLYHAWSLDPVLWIRYSRDRNAYKVNSRYNLLHISYENHIKLVYGLITLGYLDHHIGNYDRVTGKGRLSRMRASEKLESLFLELEIDEHLKYLEEQKELIILRDAEKDGVEYEDTTDTRRMRRNLQKINEFIKSAKINVLGLDNESGLVVDLSKTQLHRVFNLNFERGGRFYGAYWQGMPSRLRQNIAIDGEKCCELDYSSFHIRMIYLLNGYTPPEGDMYAIGNYERKVVKIVANIMINAKNRTSAVKGSVKKLREEGINLDHKYVSEVVDAVAKKHKLVAKYLYADKGAECQFVDSQICEEILLDLMGKNIVCLPVHDSFVVQERHVEELAEAMTNAYRKHLKVDPLFDRKF